MRFWEFCRELQLWTRQRRDDAKLSELSGFDTGGAVEHVFGFCHLLAFGLRRGSANLADRRLYVVAHSLRPFGNVRI
jgi:TnpA family transposase